MKILGIKVIKSISCPPNKIYLVNDVQARNIKKFDRELKRVLKKEKKNGLLNNGD